MSTKRTIITPSARSLNKLEPDVQVWVREVTLALNGGVEGADVVRSTTKNTDGILAGTKALSGVIVDGIGDLKAALDSQSANIASSTNVAGAAAGGLTATINKSSFYGVAPSGSTTAATADDVLITVSGGTAPYTCAITKNAGDTISLTANPPASGTGSDEFTTTLSAAVADGESKQAEYCADIADDAAGSYRICFSITLINFSKEGDFDTGVS